MIAWSILLPATRTEDQATIPPRDITAISAVPPPILTIILPEASFIGIFAPIAARTGSLITYAAFAPACTAASTTALLSVEVTPAGTEIIISGLNSLMRPQPLLMKYSIIASVIL